MDTIDQLKKYLTANSIHIDIDEFRFQCRSHPSFPSLLAVIDTLSFFGLKSVALRLQGTELDLLPCMFITSIKIVKKEYYNTPINSDHLIN